MAKVTEHIANAGGKTLFSFEILPPLKGESIDQLFQGINPLMEFKPPFIDVTYHREEYVYRNRQDGGLEKRTIRKRPGTVGICAAIMNRFSVDAVPHMICGGFTREETENALIDLDFLGIDNVLALRGDHIKSEGFFKPEPEGHAFASDLILQIKSMNAGQYLDEDLQNAVPTDFCIGVAGYPEKHFEAPNMAAELKYTKLKADLGGDYVVTQMFFNNAAYFEYVKKCREIGMDKPIIPGLKPITTKKQLTVLPRTFSIDIPEDLANAIEAAKDDKAARQVGIEWCIAQSKELMKSGVPVLHYYSMGKSDAVRQIAAQLF